MVDFNKYYCKEHDTVWFRKGNMRGYAHPIKDERGNPTGQWCNMPKEATKPQNLSVDAPQSKSTPLPEQTRPIPPSIDRDHDIHRQVALKIASALAEAKLIPLEAIPFRTEYYNKLLDGTIKYSEEGVDLIQKMDMAYALEALAKYNKKAEAK